jgi:DNA-binding transcriptional LysR family regulator
MMDLAALAIFRAVVRENGVTRAAAKLNRVQSNVTTRIKQLEAELGTDLFTRDGRKLVLTPAGHTLLGYAERLLALADEARHAIAHDRPHGRLRLGTMESTAASRLPQRLAEYYRNWPEVTLELETGTTGRLIERLRAFEIDAAIISAPLDTASSLGEAFDATPVYRERLVMIAPSDHPPIRRARDVQCSTLVAFERGCAYRTYAEQWYARDGMRPGRVLELGSYHAIVACVAAGAGVAVAPRSVLDLQRDVHGVSVHPLGEIGEIDTLLVWRRGHGSAAAIALRELLLSDGAGLRASASEGNGASPPETSTGVAETDAASAPHAEPA